MPTRNFQHFRFPHATRLGRGDMAELHTALSKLGIAVGTEERRRGEFGATTREAVKAFQQRMQLTQDGVVGPKTVAALQAELAHAHFARSKTRTARLHTALERLGYAVSADESSARRFGASTLHAVRDFQHARNLPGEGRLNGSIVAEIEAAALAKRFTTKTQVGQLQRKLLRALRIGKLEVRIAPEELRGKSLGPSSLAAIGALQRKYGLPQTGRLDPETHARIESIAASRSRPQLARVSAPRPEALTRLPRPLRLNMQSPRVGELQKTLSYFGHAVARQEFDAQTFGKTTREGVLAFQRSRGLSANGHADGETLKALNLAIVENNPAAAATASTYRLRGALRDELWRGRAGQRVQIWERTLNGETQLLAERKTLDNGFYDVPYEPPRNAVDGSIKEPFHLSIRVLDAGGQVVETKTLFNPTPIAWTNFTAGTEPYRGESEFERQMRALAPFLSGSTLVQVEESDAKSQITYLALNAGIPKEFVMRLALAHRMAAELAAPALGPELFFGFLSQNLPPDLPSDLLGSTERFTLIGALVERALRGVVFMTPELQATAFDNAAQQNLIPIVTQRAREAILAALVARRQSFALTRPILVGNGSLEQVLETSSVPQASYAKVAEAMLAHGGLGPTFWSDVRSRSGEFGGDAALLDLEASAQLGEITKHHAPLLGFLKGALANPAFTALSHASDCAKLDQTEWQILIDSSGGQVPVGIEGDSADARKAAYALTLATQSEQLFPAIALAAEVGRSDAHGLSNLSEVAAAFDAHPELDLRTANLDGFFRSAPDAVTPPALLEMKVLQRVQRLAPSAKVGRALVEDGFHHSAAVLFRGREQFVKRLSEKGVESRTALTTFGRAELQYAQVLQRLTDFRFELHRADPQVIISHVYSAEEQAQALGDLPNLAALFGSNDFCDCQHCQSVYGPAAYLADVLRFLSAQPSEISGRTVLDILLERRPDLANIKLNCDNTSKALPYVDLACEVLEAAVPAPLPEPNFAFQSTWLPAELRAFPEHVRPAVYDELRKAMYPNDAAFDLWQVEARTWLDHLGVPRHELMSTLQARPGGSSPSPADASIAGEAFAISTHELEIITQPAATATAQQEFWGFDPTRSTIPVREFLDHAKLDVPALEYRRLLELLQAAWLSTGNPPALALERPAASCDLGLQSVVNVTLARLDRIQRFLRLWRRTGLEIWQLDLLLRAPRLGNGVLDAAFVVRLWEFRRVQKALRLSFDAALALFHQLNTEARNEPDDPSRPIEPAYARIFQSRTVTDPIDPDLALPLDASQSLSAHQPAFLAAYGISSADFELLAAKTDGKLKLENLSRIHAYLSVARGLGLDVGQLLLLEDLAGLVDPFSTPRTTLEFVELFKRIRASGFRIDELDFLLNLRPDSAFALREEALVRLLEGLREALRTATNEPLERAGQLAERVSGLFAFAPERAKLVLEKVSLVRPLGSVLDEPRLVERDPTDPARFRFELIRVNFPDQFQALELLHKLAFLLERAPVATEEELDWLLTRHDVFGLLAPGALPVAAQPLATLLPRWAALLDWLELSERYPAPEGRAWWQVLDFAAAVDAGGNPLNALSALHAAIAALAPWPVADLGVLHGALGLEYGAVANDYTSFATYLRLARCFRLAARLGVTVAAAASWAERDTGTNQAQAITAQETRNAAKAKYDFAVWLERAAPIEDTLRERKRTALGRYLVEHSLRTESPTIDSNGKSFRNPRYFRNEDDLFQYFLIDVEMCACQLTSRVKQAISSVQMFVQRCFLNLVQPHVRVSEEEREDSVSLNSWRQWRYMKNYRVWEAARKVFLYPENWLEPELRDDKTPFFRELETELLQSDLTHEHAEACFHNYLERLREVSRLEIIGAYHEVDDENPNDDLPPSIDLLHVIGRTRAEPAIYYYRRFDRNDGTWSAWEKIDVDLTGDHVVPVVYNRKLYLFWLVFLQKPQKNKKQPPAKATTGPTNSPEPPTQLEIQLAWTERKDRGWTAKKVSREKLVHPWDRPLGSYHLKPRYKSRENLLWLDLYISTSREFNDTRFYDPFVDAKQFQSAFRFDETGRPWHSSSFLFDGAVVGVKLKPLRGFYHLVDSSGDLSDALTATTSYDYVRTSFGPTTQGIQPLQGGYEVAPRLILPEGMHFRFNRLTNNRRLSNPNRLNVTEHGASRTLATGAHSPFEIVFSLAQIQFDTAEGGAEPVIYQDASRSFFVNSELTTRVLAYNTVVQQRKYTFFPFYHPYSALFLRELARSGTDGLLTRRLQRFPHAYFPGNTFQFAAEYAPVAPSVADATAARDTLDFTRSGAYAVYNWEVFFQAPLLIACRLKENQRFEEALRWFHYIFDPTSVDGIESPQRFWVTKPFYEQSSEEYRKQRIENLLANLGVHLDELRSWKNDPFNPHRIARFRPVAYQKNVVMRYIDNLIAWGDQLFGRDTLESINEATTLYLLAYEILGPRPVRVPGAAHQELSYAELIADGALDPLGNQGVPAILENLVQPPTLAVNSDPGAEPLPLLDVPYFCIPPNDQLLEYWARVEDRLFKIRHCMNIEGVVRQLPLFEPPIDPALLVKAAAAGVDIGSVLALTDVDPGQYRFRTVLGKALEFCAEVRALGDKLLSLLEKRDAESLAQLRASQESALLDAMRQVRQLQIDEATEAIAALEQSKLQAEERRAFFANREFINNWEGTALILSGTSALAETAIAAGYILAGGLKFIPTFVLGGAGFGGSPTVHTHVVDGNKIGDAAEAAVKTLRSIATSLDKYASLANTMGSYNRRQEEWDHQKNLASHDIAQIEHQLAGAALRKTLAERELLNLELQIEHAKTTEDFYKTKYTNLELFSWMLEQVTGVYFRAYKLAFDMARRAEKCLQFELGDANLSFVQFGYWDSLRKGLLSGDRLASDLRRLEAAQIELNRREFELVKHVSIANMMPLELLELKAKGACDIELPEWLFDMDHPGHYRRRIKSVAISIPCVAGPYQGVHATLSLVAHGMRANEDMAAGFGDPLSPDGPRFVAGRVPVDSIATSSAQNDAGVFELNFNDERYLPFEGAGAVSRWRVSLPKDSNGFDFDSISDLIIHLRYTAQAGGPALTSGAKTNLALKLPTEGAILVDLKHGFASEWQQFLTPAVATDQILAFNLAYDHFPFYARNRSVRASVLHLFVESSHGTAFNVAVTTPGTPPGALELAVPDPTYAGAQHLTKTPGTPVNALGRWLMRIKKDTAGTFRELTPDDIRNAYLVLKFAAT